jgi:hypothetical protein
MVRSRLSASRRLTERCASVADPANEEAFGPFNTRASPRRWT